MNRYTNDEEFDPADLEMSVTISREFDESYDVLRVLEAAVTYSDELDGRVAVGKLTGWIGRYWEGCPLEDAGDSISEDAMVLASAAQRIIDAEIEEYFDSVVLLNRIVLEEDWRGQRLTGPIITQLLNLLQLEPTWTVLVLQAMPLDRDGSPLEDGPESWAALAKLESVYRKAGFESAAGGPVWWRLPHTA